MKSFLYALLWYFFGVFDWLVVAIFNNPHSWHVMAPLIAGQLEIAGVPTVASVHYMLLFADIDCPHFSDCWHPCYCWCCLVDRLLADRKLYERFMIASMVIRASGFPICELKIFICFAHL
jgi:hypothetical protein